MTKNQQKDQEIKDVITPKSTVLTIQGINFTIGEMGYYQLLRVMNFYMKIRGKLDGINADTPTQEIAKRFTTFSPVQGLEGLEVVLDNGSENIPPPDEFSKLLKMITLDEAISVFKAFFAHNKMEDILKKVNGAMKGQG